MQRVAEATLTLRRRCKVLVRWVDFDSLLIGYDLQQEQAPARSLPAAYRQPVGNLLIRPQLARIQYFLHTSARLVLVLVLVLHRHEYSGYCVLRSSSEALRPKRWLTSTRTSSFT